jgi:hypothetical protein
MSFIKKYQRFVEEFTATAPARPDVKPDVTEKPKTAPSKPSPFRRDKPSTEPGTKASAEDVAERFIQMMVDNGESVEKYIK